MLENKATDTHKYTITLRLCNIH